MKHTRSNQLISEIKNHPEDDALLAKMAVELAGELLGESRVAMNGPEKRQGAKLARMMKDASGKAFTLAMADQVFRPPSSARSASQFRNLVSTFGVPEYLSAHERAGMFVGSAASAVFPGIVMPAVTGAMRHESSSVILPAENDKLKPLLGKRARDGMRMNLNLLGEAILGEEEAEKRIQAVLDRIADPDITYISVKISAIHSQIHLVAYEETVEEVKTRLRRLYRAAMENPVEGKAKFVNLDMEEYRDLRLTCDVFQQLLDEPEFLELEAGIVLQAYLADSWSFQKQLNDWAKARKQRGGAGIKIRIVKGANLAMESVDSELHGWETAPYSSKEEVDANFKRMLHEGCKPENAAAVKIGVGSHNLFDVAYALLLREREGVKERIEFEMLEGMANHQARVVRDAASGLLLYAPIVRREDFHHAIAYLVRRLDENTSEENFLHDLFSIEKGNSAWESQKARFLAACARKDDVSAEPKRHEDRNREAFSMQSETAAFENAADTDWALRVNSKWARDKVREVKEAEVPVVPLVIAGAEEAGFSNDTVEDPSIPRKVSYMHAMAGAEQIERALACAVECRGEWVALGFAKRAEILRDVAVELAKIRGEAIATMVKDAGKSVMEGDAEISEAIDFANYYARSIESDGAELEPFGTVLVTPPWNFPFAIPCGSVLAALVAGNTVILKPAPETVLTAWVMVQALWRAGIPRDVLQFLPCPDNELGKSLVTDDRVGAVVLTGGHETAEMFLGWKPELHLFAETSGKNSLIITAAADLDQAVKDLVKSAFGHSGQKCSAASLAIVEGEIYDHPGFRRQLRDAAASLVVGPSWDFQSFATPVIRPPGEALERALTTLDPGEEWLLKPEMIDGNPCLWSPGIKIGVKPGGWFQRTECFGPVLGVVRAENLEDAMRIQNDSPFGLTGGIHSLDDRETSLWKETVEVGNAYVNRPITGAIVQRQPFGGWKRSYFGPGAKAGGPNYVAQFGRWRNVTLPAKGVAGSDAFLEKLQRALPAESEALVAISHSDRFWKEKEFGVEHDPSALRCEANIFRYRKFKGAFVRIEAGLSDRDAARLLLVAEAIGVPYEVSSEIRREWMEELGLRATVESEIELLERFPKNPKTIDLLRAPNASGELRRAANQAGIRIAAASVVWNARLEWPAWLREQAISETLHRYGNIVAKG
ncbi:proline dehydrogenase family protein [Luteolibacter algae]|uniref:L-glutamate gamma-semialdehyde dehydrogenase n=1 Tax=Luteolibacter algae TaxID=454151 RepID=A0ABW5D5V8_9BACT